MNTFHLILLAVAVYLAVTSLVRLMHQRRERQLKHWLSQVQTPAPRKGAKKKKKAGAKSAESADAEPQRKAG